MSKIVFSYHARQGEDGKFVASLLADGTEVAGTTGLRNERVARDWAENAAAAYKQQLLAPAEHGTTRTAFGTFEL